MPTRKKPATKLKAVALRSSFIACEIGRAMPKRRPETGSRRATTTQSSPVPFCAAATLASPRSAPTDGSLRRMSPSTPVAT